jgi:hypothetical protein
MPRMAAQRAARSNQGIDGNMRCSSSTEER